MEAQQGEFNEAISDLENIVYSFWEYQDLNKYAEIAENVESVNERLTNIAAQAKLFQMREALFKKEATDYSRVQRLASDFAPYSNLWLTAASWLVNKEKWHSGKFDEIDAAQLEKEIFTGVKLLFKVCRFFADKNLVGIYDIAERVRIELEAFRPYVPLIVALRTEGLAPRHWKEISEKAGFEIHPEMENFTLNRFMSAEINLQEHLDVIQNVAERASKEYAIETSLMRMKNEWERVVFDCKDQFRATGTFVLKGADVVSTLLDEHIVMTQAMQFSPFKEPFADRIDHWSDLLVYMSEALDEWLKCQRAWLYLQPIFDSPDIMKQLPAESKRFKSVDTAWRNVMKSTHENPHALTSLSRDGLLDKWMEANRNLDIVQKGLDDYLETKRSIFSRFYFLSNDELLEILSQTKDPTRVQPFLRKVFENMCSLNFQEDLTVTAMFSDEGEMIPFADAFGVKGKNVELWMCEVEASMFKGVRAVVHDAIAAYQGTGGTERNDWISEHPAQAILNGSQVHWTAEAESGLDSGTLQDCFNMLGRQLMNTVALVRSGLSKEKMTTVGALIVLDVHQKDIVENLLQNDVQGATAFEWISQLRYYWDTEQDDDPEDAALKTGPAQEDLWVKLLQTVLPYGYEYLGNTTRLVITPLTDQCYMTLMGAQLLNLGGAPTGPAGTGKTESTKDLAKAIARHCVVFNCSEGMDYIMVGKFFKGLASSGSWCCFDEFNRINVEVLSVIAQQLLVLFSGKSELQGFSQMKELEFEGTTVTIRPTFNVYITMNPGYAGRTELPDNLKALFRPVAMMVPDYTLIGEIMLYSFGFESARDLAKKMTVTFRLSSEQLSSQDHYDYGMRAVRSVINAAGVLKGREAQKVSSISEDQLLLRALRDVNVPKFLRDDLPLFENIISDLFPGG
jgi:dynein heavy chain